MPLHLTATVDAAVLNRLVPEADHDRLTVIALSLQNSTELPIVMQRVGNHVQLVTEFLTDPAERVAWMMFCRDVLLPITYGGGDVRLDREQRTMQDQLDEEFLRTQTPAPADGSLV